MEQRNEFIVLVQQHQHIIHKVCCIYLELEADREDLMQEIILQAYKSFHNFRGDAQFSTWLYRVALNTAITFHKKSKRSQHAEQGYYADTGLYEIGAGDGAGYRAMYSAIRHLSEVDKALVALYLEDYSYQEIGSMLGISVNNVAVKMNRIKNKLKNESPKHL